MNKFYVFQQENSTFGHSVAQFSAPECPNIKELKVVRKLDQYGPERFGRPIFATIRKIYEQGRLS